MLVEYVLAVKEEALMKKNLAINIDPQIANIFNSSKMVAGLYMTHVSILVAPGRSHQ